MKEYLEIGFNSYGFHLETGLIDLYISSRGLILALGLVVALRVLKVVRSRNAVRARKASK